MLSGAPVGSVSISDFGIPWLKGWSELGSQVSSICIEMKQNTADIELDERQVDIDLAKGAC